MGDIGIATARMKSKYAREVFDRATRSQFRDEFVDARIDAAVARQIAETLLKSALRDGTISLKSVKVKILDKITRVTRETPGYLQHCDELDADVSRRARKILKRIQKEESVSQKSAKGRNSR